MAAIPTIPAPIWGADPSRHLPPVSQRIYSQDYGPEYNPGGSEVAGKKLISVVNASKEFSQSTFATALIADQIFSRDTTFRGNPIELTRKEIIQGSSHEAPYYPPGYHGLFGYITGPLARLAGCEIGKKRETEEYQETNVIRSENNSMAFELDFDPTGSFHVNTYIYMPETRLADGSIEKEKWIPSHTLTMSSHPGAPPTLTNAAYASIGGSNDIFALKTTNDQLIYSLKTLKSEIVNIYAELQECKDDLKKDPTNPNIQADIKDLLSDLYKKTKEFDTLYFNVALPLFKHIKDHGRSSTAYTEAKKRELESLHGEVHKNRIPKYTSIVDKKLNDPVGTHNYPKELLQQYAGYIRSFNEEGSIIPREDKYKTLLPIVLDIEKITNFEVRQTGRATLALDIPLWHHFHQDIDTFNNLFRGKTLADIDTEAVAAGRPNRNFASLAPRLFDGSGYTFQPVIFDFLDDILTYNRTTGLPEPKFTYTQLKDKFYYDYIPKELKEFMEKVYSAYGEYITEVKTKQLEADAKSAQESVFAKFLSLFTSKPKDAVRESGESETLRLLFGRAQDHVHTPTAGRSVSSGSRRGGSSADHGDPLAVLFLAMAQEHAHARGGRLS